MCEKSFLKISVANDNTDDDEVLSEIGDGRIDSESDSDEGLGVSSITTS